MYAAIEHARNSTERETERRFQIIGIEADEADARGRHQERARTHHDRKRRARIHAEQADHDQARRIQTNADRHQCTETEVDHDREYEQSAGQPERRAAGGHELEVRHQEQHGGDGKRAAHADLHVAARPARDEAGTEPRTDDRGDDERDHRERIDADDGRDK